jgi:transposase
VYCTSIDLHKNISFLTTIDGAGQIVQRRNISDVEPAILQYFLQLDDDTKVVIASTANWYWLYDLLTENGLEVVISNPVKTKAIASAKIQSLEL